MKSWDSVTWRIRMCGRNQLVRAFPPPRYVSSLRPRGDGVGQHSAVPVRGVVRRWGGRQQGRGGQSWPWCEVCVQESSGEEGHGVTVSPGNNPRPGAQSKGWVPFPAGGPLCLHSPRLYLSVPCPPICLWLSMGLKYPGRQPVSLAVAAVGAG